MSALLVDAANVVGSRPDNWWRDRPGAARRLVSALDAAGVVCLVVLEGAARRGVPPGPFGCVEVVHASGSGDDELVSLLGSHPGAEVVTADRALAARVVAAGGSVSGPRSLRDRVGY